MQHNPISGFHPWDHLPMPSVDPIWGLLQRILQDEIRHVQWLNMVLARSAHGAGMGSMHHMGQMGHCTPSMAAPAFPMGDVVLPKIAHKPEHVDRAARVVGIVTDQPFYILDFGNGKPHRWYAQEELKGAPPGVQAGESVPGATTEGTEH